jgi:hypothetical protein
VEALLRLLHELRDLGAVLLDHVVRADPRLLLDQPAPAPEYAPSQLWMMTILTLPDALAGRLLKFGEARKIAPL